jgi:hypothetical protein
MRKLRISPLFTLISFTVGILLIVFFTSSRSAQEECLVSNYCPDNIEQVRGTELIWETLSRQFISTVSTY